MNGDETFRCWMVRQTSDGPRGGIETIRLAELPPGDVLIRTAYSSLNYKDALACRGHAGVVKQLPHIPGIDCAGEVVTEDLPDLRRGAQVLVTGYDLGAPRWGGFSQYVRVPAEWVVPLPEGLTTRQAMAYGTAGFTAAQCVDALQRHGVAPGDGEVVVTGATGGVGVLAVALLAKLGYAVAAVTGKEDKIQWLQELGAQRVLGRDEVVDPSERPLLSARWAGAVDTVGGATLSTLVRELRHRGCVAACGLVGGEQLDLTVHPFILRGVTLAGIDSAKCPRKSRLEIWQKLAGPWRLEVLDRIVREATFAELGDEVDAMLSGKSLGRVVLRLA